MMPVDIGVNSSSSTGKVSRPMLLIHMKDENLALCMCLVNPALRSPSWNGTRTLQDSPRNSLISSISGSKKYGPCIKQYPVRLFLCLEFHNKL